VNDALGLGYIVVRCTRSIVCMWAYMPTDSSIFIRHILIKPPPNYQHIAVILCILQAIEVCMSFATNDADSV